MLIINTTTQTVQDVRILILINQNWGNFEDYYLNKEELFYYPILDPVIDENTVELTIVLH